MRSKLKATLLTACSARQRHGVGALGGDRSYLPFVVAALAATLLGGLILAVVLPVDAALGLSLGRRWPALAQAHGHLQSVGFVGLFIVGVGSRLTPRFSGRSLAFGRLLPVALVLLAAGVVLRAIGQSWGDVAAFRALMAAGAVAELAGAACFALIITVTAWRAARQRQPFAPFFIAGSIWFVVQAALGVAWLVDLARAGEYVLPSGRDAVLLAAQFYGFQMMFILGVALRAFPIFFALERRSYARMMGAFGLAQAGLIALVAGGLWSIAGGDRPWPLEDAGVLLLSAGLAWGAMQTGWWRTPERLRPASRPIALTIRAAMGWLVLAAALDAYFAVRALAARDVMSLAEADAVRHVLALGVILMTIVGMAHLVLPELATERLSGHTGRRRGIGFTVALSVAVVLRAANSVLGGAIPAVTADWLMAVAGVLALASLAAFAFLLARAIYNEPMLLEEAAERAGITIRREGQ